MQGVVTNEENQDVAIVVGAVDDVDQMIVNVLAHVAGPTDTDVVPAVVVGSTDTAGTSATTSNPTDTPTKLRYKTRAVKKTKKC